LQIVEEPIQIRVLQRYGDPIQLGEIKDGKTIKRWQDKGAPSSGKPLPRGGNVFMPITAYLVHRNDAV
jgi:hypothetical protein